MSAPATDPKAAAGRLLAEAIESAELAARMLERAAAALDQLDGHAMDTLHVRALSGAEMAESLRLAATEQLERDAFELTPRARKAFERRVRLEVRHG